MSDTDISPSKDASSAVEVFFVADREIGWLTGSASLTATQISAGTVVGAVGFHYTVGISFIAVWLGIWIGWLFSLRYIAPKFRAFGGITVPEYYAARFDADGAGGSYSRAIAAVVVTGIYVIYTSAQYVTGGIIVNTVLNIPEWYGMAGLAVVALTYTLLGGMRASIWTDVVFIVLMIGGVFVAMGVGLLDVGGIGGLYAAVVTIDPALLGMNMNSTDLIGFALAFGLSIVVAPYEISRVYAMRNTDTVQKAIVGSLALQAILAVSVAVLGLIARVTFTDLSTPDAAVATLMLSFFEPVVSGLLLVGILAAVLSTIDSVLLVSSSAVAYDLYECILQKRLAEREWDITEKIDTLVIARLTTVGAGVVPLVVAVNADLFGGLIQLIIALYASLIAGGFFIPVVGGMYWSGLSTTGALAGTVVGTGGVLTWHLLLVVGLLPPTVPNVPPVIVGLTTSLIAAVGGSWLQS